MIKKPDFFIVGAPKSGTTAMDSYLGQHPEVFMARKELHFFGKDLRFGRRFYRRDEKAYLEEFRNRNGHRLAGEASVWYLLSRQAAVEMKAFNPQARVIIMLREPVEMLHSLFFQFCCDANEHLGTFEEALAAEPERRVGRRLSRLSYFAQGLVYRETAFYSGQVRRYLEVFGRENVHVIVFDDFAANPEAAYRGVLDFLGLKFPKNQTSFPVMNGCQTVRCSALRTVLSDPLVRSTAVAMGRCLPRPLFVALRQLEALVHEANKRPQKRPPLAPELRARLKQEFSSEVEKLSALLDRDLTHWCQEQTPALAGASHLEFASACV